MLRQLLTWVSVASASRYSCSEATPSFDTRQTKWLVSQEETRVVMGSHIWGWILKDSFSLPLPVPLSPSLPPPPLNLLIVKVVTAHMVSCPLENACDKNHVWLY